MMSGDRADSYISLLSDELLVEILCRLGFAKVAFQCKSVCKLWCSLLDSHTCYFSRRWRQLNVKKQDHLPVALLTRIPLMLNFSHRHSIHYCTSNNSYTRDLPNLNLNFLPSQTTQICILTSSKDLLLCCPIRWDHTHNHRCYYVCNPFTKQWTALPPPPPGRRQTLEEYEKDIKVGFSVYGGDELKFRVVRIVPCRDVDGMKLEIWVFKSDESKAGGRRMGDIDMFKERSVFDDVVSQDEMMVWFMVADKAVDRFEAQQVSILRWDSTIHYRRLPLPWEYRGRIEDVRRSGSAIGVCEGRLRVAQFVNNCQMLMVWELDERERRECVMVQEMDMRGAEEGWKDWRRAIASHEGEEWFIIQTSALLFHPCHGDIMYMVSIMSTRLRTSSYIFMCNIRKRRVELIREIPTLAASNHFLSVVPHSWPTPLPTLDL